MTTERDQLKKAHDYLIRAHSHLADNSPEMARTVGEIIVQLMDDINALTLETPTESPIKAYNRQVRERLEQTFAD